MSHCHFRTLGEICPLVYFSLYPHGRSMSSCLFLSITKTGEICPFVYNVVSKTGELCPRIINGRKMSQRFKGTWQKLEKYVPQFIIAFISMGEVCLPVNSSALRKLEKYVPMLVMPSSNTGELCLRIITHLLDIGRNIYLDNVVPGDICTR